MCSYPSHGSLPFLVDSRGGRVELGQRRAAEVLRHDGVRLVVGPVCVDAFVRLLHRVRELNLGSSIEFSSF